MSAPFISAEDRRLLFPNEPPRLVLRDDLNRLLRWAAENDVSDLHFKSDLPLKLNRYGRVLIATRRTLTNTEVGELINVIYGPTGTAHLKKGEEISTAYEFRPLLADGSIDRELMFRFRVCAVGVAADGEHGIHTTMRVLPADPPTLASRQLEPELEHFLCNRPPQGLLLITGKTGSGKSTLLAAWVRYLLEDPESDEIIETFEAPIEFRYDAIEAPAALIAQSEIPWHLHSFADGVRSAMRRGPTVIIVGESRDTETMSTCIEASNTGHFVASTVHSNGVPATLQRALQLFPAEERLQQAINLMESLQGIVTQRLLPTIDGKRVAVREFLLFTDEVRAAFFRNTDLAAWPEIARQLLVSHGQPMAVAVRRVYEAGLISALTAKPYLPEVEL